MLLQLPACVTHLESIAAIRSECVEPSPFMLYSSIWGPRCGNKAFTAWLKVGILSTYDSELFNYYLYNNNNEQ